MRKLDAVVTTAYKSIALAILACVLGCSKPEVADCWSPGTKATVAELTKTTATEHIDKLVKTAHEGKITDEEKIQIAANTSIALSHFHVTSAQADIGHLTCGVTVNFGYSKADGGKLTGETSMEFEIFKGETGQIFSVARAPIAQMVAASDE